MLADAYGLYYNKDLLEKAGLTEPPKTVAELMDYAKKLTVKNADGSLEVVGFDPSFGFFENTPRTSGRCAAPSGSTTRASRPSPATRPGRTC